MKDSTLLSIFILFFFKLMQQLVEKTKRFTHQYLGMLDKGHTPLPDVTIQETRLFLSIIVQMGPNQRNTL
jgi:hypothetical protein